MTRKVGLSLLLLLLIIAVGCGPRNPNAPASVSGQATYNGKTLTAGVVAFHFKDKGVFEAPIASDGNFAAVDLPTGEATVTVETESANPGKKQQEYKGGGGKGGGQVKKGVQGYLPEGAKKGAVGEYVKIPKKYSDPTKTDLKATIKPGKNDGLTFPLKD